MLFRQNIGSFRLNWPEYDELEPYVDRAEADYGEAYMDNFNFTDSCELHAAMCCFVATRSGEAITDGNVDVCAHDIGSSRHSSRVANGFAFYDGQNTDPYCVAMTWGEADNDWTNLYKGNALFELSYGTFLDKEYVKNIPGAPMCGCLENMPIVKPTTQLGCVKTAPNGQGPEFEVTSGGVVTMKEGSPGSVDIQRDCDFTSEYESLHAAKPDMIAKMKKRILDPSTTCKTAEEELLNERLYVPGTTEVFDPIVDVSTDNWAQFAGNGLSYFHTRYLLDAERRPFFDDLYERSSTKIMYRHCETCIESHRHIFYKRLIAPVAEFNLLDTLMNNWYEANNKLGEHFSLHSTYADALAGTNPWTYCNYQEPDKENVGFPRDCGPTQYVPCQWNSYKRTMCGHYDYNPYSHGWYIDMSP